MKPRLIGACIVAVLGLVVPAAIPVAAQAATIELDIDTMPRGSNMHVAWMDKTDNPIHACGFVADVAFDHPVLFRYANFGYVVDGEGDRLVYHQFSGGARDVMAAKYWRIRTGLKAGRQIAAITRRDGAYWLHVRSLVGDPASSLVFRKRLGSTWRLRGFHNTRVWVGGGYVDIRNGRFVKVARLDSSRRRQVDTRLNVVASSRPLETSPLSASSEMAPMFGFPPAATISTKMPNRNGTSPMRVVMNALFAALELVLSSHQCPIRR